MGTAPVMGVSRSTCVSPYRATPIRPRKRSRKGRKSKKIIRSVRLLLLPDRDTEQRLFKLCDISMKAYNEVNYLRRRDFFSKRGFKKWETYNQIYDKYKDEIGSATTQQVLNKNNEDWDSFFGMLKAMKNGELPWFIKKVSPPGYKDRRNKKDLMAFIRNDQYEIYEDKICVHGLGRIGSMCTPYKGDIHVRGKQGRMQIFYDHVEKKWYAIVSFDVVEKRIRGSWFKIPMKPKGDLAAGIDVGINNLYAVYIEDGRALLINGRPLKAIAHYWGKEKIPEYQSRLNKSGYRSSRRLARMYRKWYGQARHYINTKTRELVEKLYQAGVSRIYVGYPKNISQDNGNFNTVNLWTYRYILNRLRYTAEEYGIEVVEVREDDTSTSCPLHDPITKSIKDSGDNSKKCGARIKRGLLKCRKLNKLFNADLAGAYNILRRGLAITPKPRKGAGRNGPETRPRGSFLAPNLPALSGGNPAL